MSSLLLAANVILVVLLALVVVLYLRTRRRLDRALGRPGGGPIASVRLDDFDPLFASTELGPTPASEVAFIGKGDGVPHGTTDEEAWILAVLAKRSTCLFEFGTCTGRTAYLWARNSAPDAQIITLTLLPDQKDRYATAPGDSRSATRLALGGSTFARFLYTGTEAEKKITQLFGDSKELDESPYLGQCDLIFIDGSHAYSYVKNDTEKALRMLKEGGLLLWHDYREPAASGKDVYRYLNELSRTLPLVRLGRTSLVAYRAGAGGGSTTSTRGSASVPAKR